MPESFWVFMNSSVLPQVLARLLFRGFVGKVAAFESLHSDIGRRQQWAQGFREHRIRLQGIQGGVQAGREPCNAALFAFSITEIARVNVDGLAWVELAADAIEPGGEQPAHGERGIGSVVRWVELESGGLC